MDNQSSSPQILFPNVPDDFCPTGNWQEVLQQFIDIVLANGTINVPGLGDVTPQQIQTINGQLQTQQNQISALDNRVDALEARNIVTVRTGFATIPAGNSIENITFAAMPSASYAVVITPVGTATTVASGKYILQSGQTTTGFSVLINDNPATVTAIRWAVIHTN